VITRKLGLKKTGIEELEKLPSKPLMVVACEDNNWLVFCVGAVSVFIFICSIHIC